MSPNKDRPFFPKLKQNTMVGLITSGIAPVTVLAWTRDSYHTLPGRKNATGIASEESIRTPKREFYNTFSPHCPVTRLTESYLRISPNLAIAALAASPTVPRPSEVNLFVIMKESTNLR